MELMEQDVVVDVVESTGSEDFGKGFFVGGVTAIGIGLGIKALGRFVVKPLIEKIKKKKEDKEWEEACKTLDEVRESEDDE